MKKHDLFKTLCDENITYEITLEAIDEKAKLVLRHLSYKDMRRAVKVFGKHRRHILVICEYTGEIIYEKYESSRVHDDETLTRRAAKLINKYLEVNTKMNNEMKLENLIKTYNEAGGPGCLEGITVWSLLKLMLEGGEGSMSIYSGDIGLMVTDQFIEIVKHNCESGEFESIATIELKINN